ncbi:MAG: hypothetical protein Q7T18_11840 [Sedimentisphaerales bacterium]|nr:hypothetical protein [Sedimentisphaerales bacterium]
MKAQLHRVSHILHRHLNNDDVTATFKRTLIMIAVGIWLAFALCAMIAWGLR